MHPPNPLWDTVHARLRHVAAHLLARERRNHSFRSAAAFLRTQLAPLDDEPS